LFIETIVRDLSRSDRENKRMTIEVFAEWLRRQDYRVFETESSHWYSPGLGVYQAFPYHWVIQPSSAELNEFMREHRVLGLRYSTGLDQSEGRLSYHAVYEGGDYGIDALGKWARKNVRRGLKNCTVEPVTFDRIAEEGWNLQLDTLKRQGRKPGETQNQWRRRFLAASDLPGFGAWGALVAGNLAASVVTFRLEDFFYLLYQQCQGEYLAAHVNNALSFAVSQELLSRPGTRGAFYSLESFDAPESMDEFKFRMGYRAKPVRQRVVFNPVFRPLVNGLTHGVLKCLRGAFGRNNSVAKAEGMVRFFRQGRQPIERQQVSSVLRSAMASDSAGVVVSSPTRERFNTSEEVGEEVFLRRPAPKPALE
jgi:hypothetical protein